MLTHGWPGSFLEFEFLEFEHSLAPLAEPSVSGGERADAFHVVVPSLPGYAFSERPTSTGWDIHRIARAWCELMTRLGYSRFMRPAATGERASPCLYWLTRTAASSARLYWESIDEVSGWFNSETTDAAELRATLRACQRKSGVRLPHSAR